MTAPATRFLLEPEAIELMSGWGVPYPRHILARCAEEAVRAGEDLGYPVVLKVVSPDVLHKSDVGGVAVGLQSGPDVREAYGRILAKVCHHVPQARIDGLLVCQQAPPGLEVIVGMLKDRLFGPTIMFGLGGLFAEVFQDVAFRAAPLQRRDAEEMIQETRVYALLKGARGQAACDVAAVADLLLNISCLVIDRPEVEELDLNPVRVYSHGLLALDVRAACQLNAGATTTRP
jgi:acyl-CoA synthetase (NDP forming)